MTKEQVLIEIQELKAQGVEVLFERGYNHVRPDRKIDFDESAGKMRIVIGQQDSLTLLSEKIQEAKSLLPKMREIIEHKKKSPVMYEYLFYNILVK